jgi:cell division protein FtsA
MRNAFSVGIDIGTYQVKVVIAEHNPGSNTLPKIVGLGYAESKGLRHGYIINQHDAIRSIRKAVKQAEKSSGIAVERAYVSIGGIGLGSYTSTGSVMISRADAEITELDIEKVIEESKRQIPPAVSLNRQIIHTIPIEYKIDGKSVLGDPVGMKGNKLEAKIMYVNSLSHHINELIEAVESAGIEIVDAVAAPLAAGIANLSKTERVAGCVLVNIGSETVSMIVYEEDVPICIEIFKVGSNDITNDIALGMQISLEEAEKKKRREENFATPDAPISKKNPENKVRAIITSRLADVFELIDAQLKKIERSGLLPAGIILTGGGSGLTTVEDLAKASLKLPSRVASVISQGDDLKNIQPTGLKIKDSTWSVAYGLCVYGLTVDSEHISMPRIGKDHIKRFLNTILQWFKRFLP